MSDSRSLLIKDASPSGGPVVYVMSRDQRAQDNHALLTAQARAIDQKVPLYVLFVLKRIPSRSREHYDFMLSGLEEVATTLQSKNIPFILRSGESVAIITQFVKDVQASAVVFDFSPLTHARSTVKQVVKEVDARVEVIDTHNIIPAWVVSDKQEFAAHTMRRKVHKQLGAFLVAPDTLKKHPYDAALVDSVSFSDAKKSIQSLTANGIHIEFSPGEKAAHSQLETFLSERLEDYAVRRNDIAQDYQSGLSPYLHYGHISSLRVALETMAKVDETPLLLYSPTLAQSGELPSATDGMNTLLEEMIVRKELADNFCFYSKGYRSIKNAAAWAQTSLAQHADDPREFVYSKEQWEACTTHDVVWNAAQLELNKTGKMHGYLRMYWAKKLLEWSASPEEALRIAIYLNDKYSIDGGDPNGYVGMLWSIAGLHDRSWFDRPVYGKVRYMNEGGLRRKYDVEQYIARIKEL